MGFAFKAFLNGSLTSVNGGGNNESVNMFRDLLLFRFGGGPAHSEIMSIKRVPALNILPPGRLRLISHQAPCQMNP